MVYLQHSNLDLAVVELIIAQNNDVNLKSKADWSPLMYSVINPSVTIAVLELLVKSGADLHYQNKF
jgi:ankyrin repeat protein